MKYNRNFIAICIGGTGSGKSYAMLKLAELVDPKFTVDQVVFSLDEFLDLLNNKKLEPGRIIIWDEGGVEAASRDSMTKRNKLMGKVLQTFRHKNLGLLFTVPDVSFVDGQIRTLSHVLFKPISIDRVHNKCILDVSKVQRNEKLKKTYFKPFRVTVDGRKVKSNTFKLGLPSKRLRDKYEAKKTEFTNSLNITDLDPSKPEKPTVDIKGIAEDVIKNKKKFVNIWRGQTKVAWAKIATEYDIGSGNARKIQYLVESQLNG